MMTRREVLRILGVAGLATAAGLPLHGCGPLWRQVRSTGKDDSDPIDRTLGDAAPRAFSGENPSKTHRLFWGDVGPEGDLLAPMERVPVVVIGGGLSGLFTSYLLRKHKPVILEGQDRFGGNSRGESWRGIDYSLGAAYFMAPQKGSSLDLLYRELGLEDFCRVKSAVDPVFLQGRRYDGFWEGETDPANAAQFRTLHKLFLDTVSGEGLPFPDIPIIDPGQRAYMDALDRLDFRSWLEARVGGKLHPHIMKRLEFYFWSTFGCTLSEASAAAGLNAYASEFGGVLVAPGGNAAIAQRLLERIFRKTPSSRLRAGCLAFDVRLDDDGVVVSYEDRRGAVRTIHAKAVVMACPKFVVAKILRGIEPERAAAIKKLRYNAYLVGNVLLNGAFEGAYYDVPLLGDGCFNCDDLPAEIERQGATDVIVATFARPDKERTVLTLYRALPYADGRARVYENGAFERCRSEFDAQIRRFVLPEMGIDPRRIVDVRIARWGHPMPVPAVGLIAEGVCDAVRKPFRDRVFFVEQDNWAYAALETTALEAQSFAPEVERRILA
ncbi:MAG: FAD-dependent oxidoreductase [Elusimicrobiota bacterium]